jgi:NADPH-dependent 2,4-dienoyl-CoA reductase/sulfur reductase-like enzyme
MSQAGPENSYDVIVIGAGPIGLTLADRARAAGHDQRGLAAAA